MKKHKWMFVIIILMMILVNVYIIIKVDLNSEEKKNIQIEIDMSAESDTAIQLFYSDGEEFCEEKSVYGSYSGINNSNEHVLVEVPAETTLLRIDFGDKENNINIFAFNYGLGSVNGSFLMDIAEKSVAQSCIESINVYNNRVNVITQETDPFIVIDISDYNITAEYKVIQIRKNWIMRGILCLIVDLLAVIYLKHFKGFVQIPLCVVENRQMIWELAKNDFQAKFAGSYLGIFWAFVQPIVIMVLYWFVFQVGLRSGNVSEFPYVLFLMSGLIPWFYLSEAISGGSNSLLEYNYLVKKVIFDIRILPLIKIVSSFFVHMFFLIFIIVMCCIYKYYPTVYMLQLLYYGLGIVFLASGICYLTSAITVFFRDMGQIINIFLTVGVWITPIMWSTDGMDSKLSVIFRANPVFYLVAGYRDALLAHEWFWDKPIWTVYFWVICIGTYAVGIRLFNKSRAHFSDML